MTAESIVIVLCSYCQVFDVNGDTVDDDCYGELLGGGAVGEYGVISISCETALKPPKYSYIYIAGTFEEPTNTYRED